MTPRDPFERFPEGLRDVARRALDVLFTTIAQYLERIAPDLARCNAEDVLFTTIARRAEGLDPHPDIALAAMKLYAEVLVLREHSASWFGDKIGEALRELDAARCKHCGGPMTVDTMRSLEDLGTGTLPIKCKKGCPA